MTGKMSYDPLTEPLHFFDRWFQYLGFLELHARDELVVSRASLTNIFVVSLLFCFYSTGFANHFFLLSPYLEECVSSLKQDISSFAKTVSIKRTQKAQNEKHRRRNIKPNDLRFTEIKTFLVFANWCTQMASIFLIFFLHRRKRNYI